VDALIAAYKISPEWLGLKPSTRANYTVYLRDVAEIGALAVSAVRRRTLIGLRDAIASERGAGASTGFLRAASALFGWAVDRDWIEHTPTARIKALPGGHLTAWTATQADEAASRLPEPLRRVVILARYTGQRRGDLVALTWAAWDGTALRLRQQKGGGVLVLPAHPALKAELDAWKAGATSTHILTNEHGQPWGAPHLSNMLPKALARVGLPRLGVHGLRKLAATALAEAGCSAHEIAAVTGHRTLAMVQLYTASADQERLAGAAIVRLSDRKATKEKTAIKLR
jgi:integrase